MRHAVVSWVSCVPCDTQPCAPEQLCSHLGAGQSDPADQLQPPPLRVQRPSRPQLHRLRRTLEKVRDIERPQCPPGRNQVQVLLNLVQVQVSITDYSLI